MKKSCYLLLVRVDLEENTFLVRLQLNLEKVTVQNINKEHLFYSGALLSFVAVSVGNLALVHNTFF